MIFSLCVLLLYNVFVCVCVFLRHRAEGVKTTAEKVKQALVDAKTAQASAEKAINRANADIGETQARLVQV